MSQRIARTVIHGTVTRQSEVSQTTAQQGRPQGTVLRFDRQVVNADYDNRVQDEYLTQKYDL
jgi:hypothetical protein